jgi:hypothetical protein
MYLVLDVSEYSSRAWLKEYFLGAVEAEDGREHVHLAWNLGWLHVEDMKTGLLRQPT